MVTTTEAEGSRAAPDRDRRGSGHGRPIPTARATLFVTSLGFFMVVLDVTIVNVALPTIAGQLGAGLGALQWIVDGYALAFAAALLTGGALGDGLGARRMFAAGLGLFALASAACGLAPSTAALVVARFPQGLGAALMVPCALALLRNAYPDPEARARAIAVWVGAGGAAVAAGPVAGGLLVEGFGWRSIFLVNIVVGALGLIITATRVQAAPRVPRRIDWVGQLTAFAAVGGLTFTIIEGPRLGWEAPAVLAAMAGTVLGAVAFVRWEGRVGEPMLPLSLARRPTFAGAALVGCLINLAFYGQVFVLSLFFQQILGQSALGAGLSFLPMTALITVANLAAPRAAAHIGSLATIVAGELVFAAGLVALLGVGPHSADWAIALTLLPIGIGGMSIPPLTSRLLDDAPAEMAGVASGAFNASRQVGGVVGVALFGALLGASSGSGFVHGMRLSLVIAAAALLLAALLTVTLLGGGRRNDRAEVEASPA